MKEDEINAVDGREELLRGLARKLRRRNVEQTWAFKDVFAANQGLLNLNEKLRQQTLDQDKDIIILRHKLTEGLSQGETSDALRTMHNQMQRLQVQVSDRYRSSAEAASEQLRLMKEVQLLQDQLKRSTNSLEKLQGEHGASMSRCATLEDSHALLEAALATQRSETESLRSLLGGSEAEAASLRGQARKEREELMSRLLRDKGSMLEEMNKMNDENASLREERNAFAARIQHDEAARTGRSVARAAMGGDNERSQPGVPPAWMAQQSKGGAHDTAFSSSASSPAVGVPSRCFQAIEAHSSGVNDVVFDKGGGLLATAGDDSYVKVWDPGSGRQRAVLKGAAHKGVSAMITVDIHGDMVCGGGSDGSCTVWSLRTCRERARLTGHQQKVCAVAFCCAGQRLVTGSQDCSIKVWDLHRGQWDATTTAMRAPSKCNALDVSQSWKDAAGTNAVVASGHMDGVVRLWDMRSGTCAHQVQGLHTDQVTSVRFAPSRENMLLTNSRDGTLKLVDARMYKTVACLGHPHLRTATSFSRACLSPSARFAAAASANGNVYVWDIARAATLGSKPPSTPTSTAIPTASPTATLPGPSSAVAMVLERHGAAAIGCDWCLSAPHTLASCDAGGGLRVWG